MRVDFLFDDKFCIVQRIWQVMSQTTLSKCVLCSVYMQIVLSACVVFMDVCIYCELPILKSCRE